MTAPGRARSGACAALLVQALLVAACGERAAPSAAAGAAPAAVAAMKTAGASAPADAHERGRAIYNFRCYYCHGYSGDARTLAASLVSPPPRDFAALLPEQLPRERMLQTVTHGRPGTAMAGFGQTLSAAEIALVVDFVREEFMRNKAQNTRYHTEANGWPRHERYLPAYPFATGELALDTAWHDLTPAQQTGKQLYLSACVSCHDRARVNDPGPPWALRGVSYPAGNYYDDTDCEACHHAGDPDDPYEKHETPPTLAGLSAEQRRGEALFQGNCAYCHAADGSGRNWIGSFLQPSPPDFTRAEVMAPLTRERLLAATREGIANSSMPAWKQVLSDAEIRAVVAYVERAWGAQRAPAAAAGR